MKVEFKNYKRKVDACFQLLPTINFWYRQPADPPRLWIGWLFWGVGFDFERKI